eukprot:23692-Chlamydomonas_euryale.AAC.11
MSKDAKASFQVGWCFWSFMRYRLSCGVAPPLGPAQSSSVQHSATQCSSIQLSPAQCSSVELNDLSICLTNAGLQLRGMILLGQHAWSIVCPRERARVHTRKAACRQARCISQQLSAASLELHRVSSFRRVLTPAALRSGDMLDRPSLTCSTEKACGASPSPHAARRLLPPRPAMLCKQAWKARKTATSQCTLHK